MYFVSSPFKYLLMFCHFTFLSCRGLLWFGLRKSAIWAGKYFGFQGMFPFLLLYLYTACVS